MNYLYLSIHRNNSNLQLRIYRKPTQKTPTIHFTSNNPLEHKLATYNFYIDRMLPTPVTEHAKQQEWNTVCTIAINNGFPLQMVHNLKNKIVRTQETKNIPIQTQRKKWITFTYHSPLIHKVTNLFKSTNLNIAFRKFSAIYNQIYNRSPQNKMNASGIYRLQCRTCNKSYDGQTERSVEIRHREHVKIHKNKQSLSQHTHCIFLITDMNMVNQNIPSSH